MIEALFFMLLLGAVCGLVLSFASKIFYVWEDPRIAEIENFLAGANCGGCGFTGCGAAAEAVVKGKALPNVCAVAGPEATTSVAAVMGMDPGSSEPKISRNPCEGGDRAEDKFYYNGVNSCQAVAAMFGGKRTCDVGCLGYGDCVSICQFNSIRMGEHGYPEIDEFSCVGCGACERICPKGILSVQSMSERLLETNVEDAALAPCQQTCPAEIDIPGYIGSIREGNYEAAVHIIRERNPLLLACGRVCPHPCEDYCRRSIEDEAVSINQLKRFAADYEMNSGKRLPISVAPSTGKKVAVVGGGPAGISCAYFLRRLGHDAVIFEAMPKLGGMLRYGIPEYRLPKKTVDWEIQGILDLGIEARTNVQFGKDFTINDLLTEGFDAIFVGQGAWVDYNLKIDGEESKGCFKGIDFLSRLSGGEEIPIEGKKAAVVGGGNSAIDCVRNLLRCGAEEVSIVYRRTRKEMPANEVEIEAAEHEGVKFLFLAAPNKVITDDDGNVTHLEYLQMELGEPDASGRRRPVPIEGSETQLPVDILITAIGQQPDMGFKDSSDKLADLQITRWNTFDTDPETLQTNIPYLFTAGDAATGPSLVVEAIGGGRRAARSIHQYLMGEEVKAPEKSLFKRHIEESLFTEVPGVVKKKRSTMTELSPEERIKNFEEVDQTLTEEEALAEANRCLSCCRLCYTPDLDKLEKDVA